MLIQEQEGKLFETVLKDLSNDSLILVLYHNGFPQASSLSLKIMEVLIKEKVLDLILKNRI